MFPIPNLSSYRYFSACAKQFLLLQLIRSMCASLIVFLRVCIAGGVRLYYSIITQTSNDSPWVGFNMYTWESVEVNLGIVCASAPCLKSLIQQVIPKFMTSRTDSRRRGTYQLDGRRHTYRAAFGFRKGYKKAGYILDPIERNKGREGDDGESQEKLAVSDLSDALAMPPKVYKTNAEIDVFERVL